MDKRLYKYLSQIQAMDNDPCVIVPDKEIRSDSDLDRVLSSIFEVDPKSGLPMSDVQYYLSPNGNPQVREWLINNLMKPRRDAGQYSIDNLTDDMIVEFSRGVGESIEDYRDRLHNLGVEAKTNYEKYKLELENNID